MSQHQQPPGPLTSATGAYLDPLVPAPKRRRWPRVVVPLGTFVLGIIIGAAPSDSTTPVASDEPAAAPTVTVTAEPAPAETVTVKETVTAKPPKPAGPSGTIDGDGTWLVGQDVKAGTYRAKPGPDDNCYWARLKGTSGELDDILANGNPTGPTVVTIRSSDKAFETSSCGTWERIS